MAWLLLLKHLLLTLLVNEVLSGSVLFLEKAAAEYKIIEGGNLTMDCSVNEPKAVKSITWSRDDGKMERYRRAPKEVYSKNRLVMTLRYVTGKDSARYSCHLVMGSGSLTKKFDVPPIAEPLIITLPKKFITAKVDEPVRFKCAVSKYYTTSYKWFKNGDLIKSDQIHDTRYKIKKYQFFKIRRVQPIDKGSYTCSVSNRMGTQEVIYFLDVRGRGNATSDMAPKLLREQPKILHLDIVLNDITLDCRVTGARPINMTWLKDGNLLVKRKGFKGTEDYHFLNNRQRLKLSHIIPSDQGFYTCIAENQYGKITHEMEVDTVERKRAAPYFLNNKESEDEIENEYVTAVGENVTISTRFLAFGSVHFQMLFGILKFNKTTNISTIEFEVLETKRKYWLLMKSGAAQEYQLEFYFHNISEKEFGNYTVMVGSTIGYDVFTFSIKKKHQGPLTTILPIPLKKSFVDGPIFIVLVLCACFLVVATLATFLYCIRSKRGFNNNDNTLYSKERLERVVLNLDNGVTPKSFKNSIMGRQSRDGTRRMSSCQTEKEYITQQNIPADPEWDVNYENIEFQKVLGEGAFGRVMLGVVHGLPRNPDPMSVAIKMLKNDATEQELKDLLSEMQVMKTIGKHTNIINLLGVSTQQDELCMIVEYCRYGNLRDFLKERRPTMPPCPPPIEQLTLQNLLSYCLQVAKGMDYLSSRKCVHRDIAARNVLVADDHVLKIADFGLARDIHGDEYYRKHTDGRLPVKWMALEALFDRVYTTQSDVWSYGILIWEIVTFGGSPYPGVPFEKLCDLLNEGYRMERPVNCTDQMYRLMSDCWKPEPTRRPTFAAIVEELEQVLLTISGLEYLQLEPLLGANYPTESLSSEQNSPIDSRRESSNVFEDIQPIEDDDGDDDDVISPNIHLISEGGVYDDHAIA